MADAAAWSVGYARESKADFDTFEKLQPLPVPECHRLQFLQMACEKLAKAHLCAMNARPADLRTSHAYTARTLPVILRRYADVIGYSGRAARETLHRAKLLAREIEVLAPSVDRDGQRPDNCEYPWEDAGETLHLPLDWAFYPSQLLMEPAGVRALKLIRGAIDQLAS